MYETFQHSKRQRKLCTFCWGWVLLWFKKSPSGPLQWWLAERGGDITRSAFRWSEREWEGNKHIFCGLDSASLIRAMFSFQNRTFQAKEAAALIELRLLCTEFCVPAEFTKNHTSVPCPCFGEMTEEKQRRSQITPRPRAFHRLSSYLLPKAGHAF